MHTDHKQLRVKRYSVPTSSQLSHCTASKGYRPTRQYAIDPITRTMPDVSVQNSPIQDSQIGSQRDIMAGASES